MKIYLEAQQLWKTQGDFLSIISLRSKDFISLMETDVPNTNGNNEPLESIG